MPQHIHQISLQEAINMTARYRASRPEGFPVCESFNKDSIARLLQTGGCTFLRIYYGQKPDGTVHAILVAADAEGNDLLPVSQKPGYKTVDDEDDPVLLEDSYRCPPLCPPPSDLNGGEA